MIKVTATFIAGGSNRPSRFNDLAANGDSHH